MRAVNEKRFRKLLDDYAIAIIERVRSELLSDGLDDNEIAEKVESEINAGKALESYLSSNVLWISDAHHHECGNCGELRACYHQLCSSVFPADCDPGTGCRTV